MSDAIRSVGGSAYRGKEPIEGVFVDKVGKHVVVGQRDQSKRSGASIFLGKLGERVPSTDYFDYNVWLDVEFPHVVFVAGKRGSGKSYDLGIMLEGLSATSGNLSSRPAGFSSVLFDLQSQFWALGGELNPQNGADAAQLDRVSKWNVKGAIKRPVLFLPVGSNPITNTELPMTIPPSSLELEDWLSLLGTKRFEAMGQAISTCRQIAVRTKPNFEIADLIGILQRPQQYQDLSTFQPATFDAVTWRLQALDETGLFKGSASILNELLQPDRCSIVLMRDLPEDLKAVTVAVLMRQIERAMSRHHQQRKVAARNGGPEDRSKPSRMWVMIDEAHLVCPASDKTSANDVIVDYVKRGRDAGLSLVLATQQPSAIDASAISQVDLTILHKLTIDADIVAATARLPAPLPSSTRIREKDISDSKLLVRELAPGEALISDSEASRTFVLRLRPRVSPHGGGEPLL